MDHERLGKLIRERKEKGWTQEEFARKVGLIEGSGIRPVSYALQSFQEGRAVCV